MRHILANIKRLFWKPIQAIEYENEHLVQQALKQGHCVLLTPYNFFVLDSGREYKLLASGEMHYALLDLEKFGRADKEKIHGS